MSSKRKAFTALKPNTLPIIEAVKFAIEPGDLKKIEQIYKEGKEDKDGNILYEPSFEAKSLLEAMEKVTDENTIAGLQAQYDALSFETLENTFNKEINRIRELKVMLERAYPGWRSNAVISQMYMAESLELLKDGSATIEDIKQMTKHGFLPSNIGEGSNYHINPNKTSIQELQEKDDSGLYKYAPSYESSI